MDWKVFATVFVAIFIAELGDKTQLATMMFAADKQVGKWVIFAGASAALVAASAIGVLAGHFLSQYMDEKIMSYVAGSVFVLIGLFMIIRT
jgi:putative Ca2+/H+ antiporter (TMEM165/GDT1 family)